MGAFERLPVAHLGSWSGTCTSSELSSVPAARPTPVRGWVVERYVSCEAYESSGHLKSGRVLAVNVNLQNLSVQSPKRQGVRNDQTVNLASLLCLLTHRI